MLISWTRDMILALILCVLITLVKWTKHIFHFYWRYHSLLLALALRTVVNFLSFNICGCPLETQFAIGIKAVTGWQDWTFLLPCMQVLYSIRSPLIWKRVMSKQDDVTSKLRDCYILIYILYTISEGRLYSSVNLPLVLLCSSFVIL